MKMQRIQFIFTQITASAVAAALLCAANTTRAQDSKAAPAKKAPEVANALPTADKLELVLKGSWGGALEYRDYQSGNKFELPMTAQIDIGKDNATISRVSTFDDGPKTGLVYITTVSLFDKTASKVTNAVFRKGRAVDVSTDDAKVSAYKDASHWTIVYQQNGTDNEKAAEIRVTQTLNGNELVALKEVKPVGAADKDYLFRNQVRLIRK